MNLRSKPIDEEANASRVKHSITIKDITLIGMLSALLTILKIALFIPQLEPVSVLIILYTLVLGRKTLFIIYVFALIEGLLYGFGIWWLDYLYVWTVLYYIARIFRRFHSPLFWAFVSGIYGLCFGALCSIPYFLMGGMAAGFAWWITGIPFDIWHGIFNFGITLLVFVPFYFVMKELKREYAK